MLGLNPVGPMAITEVGSFDFPCGPVTDELFAKSCKGNVDPGGSHPHVEGRALDCLRALSPEAQLEAAEHEPPVGLLLAGVALQHLVE